MKDFPRRYADRIRRSAWPFRRGTIASLICFGTVAGAVGGAVNNFATVALAAFVYDSVGFAKAYLIFGWIGAVPLGAVMGALATMIAIWLRNVALSEGWADWAGRLGFVIGAFIGAALAYYVVCFIVFNNVPIWWVAAIVSTYAGLLGYVVVRRIPTGS